MVKFSKTIGPEERLRLAQFGEWLEDFSRGDLLADDFDPEPKNDGALDRPTIRFTEVVGDLEVVAASYLEQDEVLAVRCSINLHIEVDMNDGYGGGDGTEGWMDATFELDLRRRRIARHRVHDLREDCFFQAP